MKCKQCNSDVNPGDRFCGDSGATLEAIPLTPQAMVRPTESDGKTRRFEGHLESVICVAFSPDAALEVAAVRLTPMMRGTAI
jgi:hypothetical protein